MSNSSSSAVREEILPLIPCPDCGDRLMTWIAQGGANAGHRFYKCVNREVGLCGFIIVIFGTDQQPLQATHQPAPSVHRRARLPDSNQDLNRAFQQARNIRADPQGREACRWVN
ncbi:uncharacterized protein [Triticum aestivum]|uniref:uncharacterized protein n=1 Tax=Triticum aestivum TaxID=4565 RepID=UPI001D0285C1|nr:uncharacterized protein LOC123047108 [Triticum aestivum]